MDSLELLYDHYKDTFELLTERLKQRDKKFVFSFIISSVLVLLTFNPDEYQCIIVGYVSKQYSVDLTNQFAVLQTFLWVALLYETLRYSQAVVNIERTYVYLDSVEKRISELSSEKFDREVRDYAVNFRLASKYANFIYKYIFPVFSIVVALLKIISEFKNTSAWYFMVIDLILCIAYIVLWVFHSIFTIKTDKQ